MTDFAPCSLQALSQTAEAVAATSKKTEKVSLVAELFRSCEVGTAALAALYLSGRPFAAYEERTLQVGGSLLWRTLVATSRQEESALAEAFRRHRDLGSAALDVLSGTSRPAPSLSLQELQREFGALADARGPSAKLSVLEALLGRATALEAKYIVKIITGEMRIGLKESLVEEALAKAYGVQLDAVKRANMLTGDMSETLQLAATQRLADARMRLFHPIGFMLASPAEDAEEAFAEFTDFRVEDKYDGIRAQAHVDPVNGKVRIYSRTLDEISGTFPELEAPLLSFADSVVLDGEILAWRNGRAMAFSQLQKRLGRKRVTPAMQREIPVAYVVFDVLALNGDLTIERPLTERARALDDIFAHRGPERVNPSRGQSSFAFEHAPESPGEPRVLRAPSFVAHSAAHMDELFDAAQERGNEGLMIKSSDSPYTPGRRGKSWLKLKRELATLDVVVTAAEYGNGKRAQVLSDYTFAVRSGEELVNVGKAYTGLTDVEIAEMTEWFKQHTLVDHGHVREVLPEIVIEVAFNAVMRSERHNSGFALRFPRIVRLRPDKPVSEIDTLERVEEIYNSQVHQRKSA